jgi:cyclopropane fatty-acyl-phospholipid synthase-like methyltransferase
MSGLEHWQDRFAGEDYRFGIEPNLFLKSQAHRLRKGQTALAIADGEGRNGVFLAEQGLDVLSLDFSPNGQAKARKLAAARGVPIRTEQADVIAWRYPPEAFDVVAAIFFQFAAPDERAAIFAGIKRTLKRGGLLLLEGYGPKQLDYKTGGPSALANLYTRELLQQAFGEFSSLDIREYDAEIFEGAGHGGMSALVDLVGVK